jgi:hypothetical protein
MVVYNPAGLQLMQLRNTNPFLPKNTYGEGKVQPSGTSAQNHNSVMAQKSVYSSEGYEQFRELAVPESADKCACSLRGSKAPIFLHSKTFNAFVQIATRSKLQIMNLFSS